MFGSSELFTSEGNAQLPNTNPALKWKCGSTTQETILIAIGAAMAVLYCMLWLFHSIGHTHTGTGVPSPPRAGGEWPRESTSFGLPLAVRLLTALGL